MNLERGVWHTIDKYRKRHGEVDIVINFKGRVHREVDQHRDTHQGKPAWAGRAGNICSFEGSPWLATHFMIPISLPRRRPK